MPRAGPVCCGRGGAVEGAQRRSAGFDIRCGPVVFGWKLGVPGQHLALNVLYAQCTLTIILWYVLRSPQLSGGIPSFSDRAVMQSPR
jgi:hypothetical protein